MLSDQEVELLVFQVVSLDYVCQLLKEPLLCILQLLYLHIYVLHHFRSPQLSLVHSTLLVDVRVL